MPRGVSSALRLLLHHQEHQPAVPRRPGCPATAAAAPRYLALCAGALCAMPAQATVKVAGSAWLRVQPASAVTTIPSSSAPLPARAPAHALTLVCACTHIHHQLSPPVLPTRDQVIVSDLLCLYAFASPHVIECPKLNGKVQTCEMDVTGCVSQAQL